MSRQIKIGNLTLGGGAPIRVQSMTNTDTMDTQATVEQALRMVEAGCELEKVIEEYGQVPCSRSVISII